jgi:hypothetical protein
LKSIHRLSQPVRYSSVFRDLLKAAKGTEIPLEESSGTIRNLLCILYGKEPPSIGTVNDKSPRLLTPTECTNLLEAVDKYDFLHVKEYIALNSYHLVGRTVVLHSDAWQILCIAAKLDQPSLAKHAIARLSAWTPGVISAKQAGELGARYCHGIMQATYSCLKEDISTSANQRQSMTWKRVSESFQLED